MTNADLCREIARRDPEWYRDLPGVAVRDPETGNRFRLMGDGEFYTDSEAWRDQLRELRESIGNDDAAWAAADPEPRALAADPDYTDPVTVNALLGSLGDVEVWRTRPRSPFDPFGWAVKDFSRDPPLGTHADRTTAILLAKLASLGG